MNELRVEKSLINIVTALVGQLTAILISFVSRLVFIRILGVEYLGVNGLFTNILSMLALVELGIGSAIVYSLYKPLAFKDDTQVKALMNFYAQAYWIIGCMVFIIGMVLLPFLGVMIKGDPNIPNLNIIYLLFLANSVISYFFAYKRSLIIADQKEFIVTIYQYAFLFILNIIQILILIKTKSFILFLLVQILFTLLQNLAISAKANKMYPFVNSGDRIKLDEESRGIIFKNARALVYHKIGGTAVYSTGNIIMSAYIGVIWVGLYSNYSLITNALNGVILQLFSAITASVGNLNAYGDKERSNFIFKVFFFVSWWIFGFSSICLLILLEPFITLWIGSQFTMPFSVILMIVINFYITGMRRATITFNNSMGFFWYERYKPLAEAVVNLIAALVLVHYWGIIGVLFATFLSTMTVCFWVEPYILYKYGLERSKKEYYSRYIQYTLITTLLAAIMYSICNVLFKDISIANFLGRLAASVILPNVLIITMFYKTEEFQYLFNIAKRLWRKGFSININC